DKPGYDIPAILVGGTNGKGTTSGLLWNFLAASGLRAGLFTSPHLVEFCERIQCSHTQITDQIIFDFWEKIKRELPADIYDALSFFEVTALIAFKIFESLGCDINVLEVGMGGRLDASNISNPLASVIVGIGRDHQKFLGTTLYSITREKLGIARRDRPLFLGSGGELYQDRQAYDLFIDTLSEMNCPLWKLGTHFGMNDDEIYITIPGLSPLNVKMPAILSKSAQYLKNNFCLAMAVFHWYREKCISKENKLTSAREVASTFPRTDIPWSPSMAGRFFRTKVKRADGSEKCVLMDVCHNIDGVTEFEKSLRAALSIQGKKRVPGIVSILNDKDINPMLDILKGILDPIVLFKIDHERTIKLDDLAERHRSLKLYESFADLWSASGSLALSGEEPYVICGSVLAVGSVLEYFSKFPRKMVAEDTLVGDWSFDRFSV
ncbi:MAG: hypothetical protein HQK54_07570, partial [Oligoflexales bacterium]|nr:hypothetical protein [Oligoflexales bacterium]